ncbi:MAG: glycosyltransferase [Kiritimatiellales bacterium]
MTKRTLQSVLVTSLKSIPSWHLDVTAAFEEAGLTARAFITTPQTFQEQFSKRAKKKKWFCSEPVLDRLINNCREFRPNMILFLGMFVIPEQIIDRLDNDLDYRPLLIGWACDCHREPKFDAWKPAGHVFYFDTFMEKTLPGYYSDSSCCTYLPLGVSPQRYYDLNTIKGKSLLFVGTLSDNRKEVIDRIMPSIPVEVFGPRSSRQRSLKRKKLSSEEINSLYNHHLITLNINQPPNTEYGANMRVFEATGSGTLLLTQYSADLEALYTPGTEILIYSSPDELIELYNRYSVNEPLCTKIAAAGRRRTLAEHTFFHRINTILNTLS